VSVLQVRRQGEADAELAFPVIKAVVSPPPEKQPGPDLVRGGMEGTGRGGTGSKKKERRRNPNTPLKGCGVRQNI